MRVGDSTKIMCFISRLRHERGRILNELRDIVSTVSLRTCFLRLPLALLFLPAVSIALFGFSMSSMSFSLSSYFPSSLFSSESLCGSLRFRGSILASSNITPLLMVGSR